MSRLKIVDKVEEKKEIIFPTITNEMSVLDVAIILGHKCPSWAPVILRAFPELQIISEVLTQRVLKEGHFYPNKDKLFAAFEKVPLNKVRVVIVGQDPYPAMLPNGLPRAQGSSFSLDESDEITRSLQTIFAEIKKCYPEWVKPSHGNLSKWEDQGVFLLNACLSCPPNVEGGHFKYQVWFPFIKKVIEAITEVRPNCIYLLWGKEAQKMNMFIGEKAHRLMTSHPTARGQYNTFSGCGHFKMVNDLLVGFGEKPITW